MPGNNADWGIPGFSLVLPPFAPPGSARIFIGPNLPAPLNTYTFTDRAGYGSTYAAAIIFYNTDIFPPLDDTYTYIAVVENIGAFSAVHVGHVQNGVVREISPGVPAVQIWGTEGSSVATQKWLSAGTIGIEALSATGQMIIRSLGPTPMVISGTGAMNVSAGANLSLASTGGTSTLTATGNTTVSATGGGSDVVVTANDLVNITGQGSGVNVTASAASGDIVLTAGRNINLDPSGGELQLQTVRAYLLTQIQTNRASASLALTTVQTAVAGTLITLPTVTANARYKVQIVYDMDHGASADTGIGRLVVDGVAQAAEALSRGTIDRNTVTQTYSGTLAAAGNHTFELQALATAAGFITAVLLHTGLTVEIFESGG